VVTVFGRDDVSTVSVTDDVRMFVGAGAVSDVLRRRFVHRNWLVPRRVMCILFWTAVLFIFIGMILLVTSQHKGR